MQQRSVRLTVMALLCASGLVAAYFLWTFDRRADASVTTQAAAVARLARMSETIAGIGAAQQSYVAAGQLDEPWFERTTTLLDQLSADIEQARVGSPSPKAAEAVEALARSTEALTAADTRARQNLGLGQDLMASDVIFSDGRNILDAMVASLHDLQAAEQASHRAELGAISRERWIALGLAALVWAAGLLALVTIPAAPVSTSTSASLSAAGATEIRRRLVAELPAEMRANFQPPHAVDLASAASLCTDLSRVTSTDALPGLIGRAARILDASGVMLWMSAGEQLFPVMGHGYRQDILERLGPIARDAENAAAEAWRMGQLTVVEAAVPTGHGAIVVPLFGLHACIGVLAAEVRHGAERDPATQAVAAMIAAQLATLVPTWPAASVTEPAETAKPGEATHRARSA